MPITLVLASGSAARLRVLRDAGLDPEVVVSGVDEGIEALDTPAAVMALARRKALAVAERRPDALVVGCDSMLDADGLAMGKPASPEEALSWCRRLSGREATLYTGHCVVAARGRAVSEVAATLVRFATTTDAEIDAYVATGEPLAMAGAFSLEGLGAPFIDGIDGDPSNVIGLSLPLLRRMLAGLGLAITDLWRQRGPNESAATAGR
jgi:septum formation protein